MLAALRSRMARVAAATATRRSALAAASRVRVQHLATAAATKAAAPKAAAPAAAAAAKGVSVDQTVPVIGQKKGLKSYTQPTAFEVVAAPLVPYMSAYQKRICKKMKPIAPVAFKLYGEGLKVALSQDGRTIHVEARGGKAAVPLHDSVTAALHDGYVMLSAVPMHANAKAMLGTTRAHLANAIHGVHFGHSRRLSLVGIGYRAKVEGQNIELRVGFSHAVNFPVPAGITASMPNKDTIQLKGIDVHSVMLCAAELRRIRPPNAYTGQGIRYSNEQFVAKPGKKKSS